MSTKTTLKTSKFLLLFSLAIAVVSFASCSKKNEATGTGYVQFTNAAETASPVDFYVDNTKINNTALAYNQSTSYFAVTSTDHPAIIKSSASGANAVAFHITPLPNAYYSVFYVDAFTASYPDDVTPPQAGKARVRFINLNLDLTADIDFGITGGAKIITGLVNKLSSAYVEVNPGTTFSLYTAGSTTELLNIPTTIQAGHIYTIYLSGTTTVGVKATVLLQK
jgi:hypothetical protein